LLIVFCVQSADIRTFAHISGFHLRPLNARVSEA
jgi:hypothetical protein